MGRLATVVTRIFEERLPGSFECVVPSEDDQAFLRIPAAKGDFGEIDLYDDGDEVTIVFGRFTHSHYNCYEDLPPEAKEARIAEEVFAVVNDTFHDRIEFWDSHQGSGGYRPVGEGAKNLWGRLSGRFGQGSSRTFYRWSGAMRTGPGD